MNLNSHLRQTAFTLIELIVTIVIIGIIASIAAPRFANLSDDAESKVFQSVRTSFKSSILLIRSKSMLHVDASGFPDILVQGNCVQIDPVSGYPEVDQTSGTCSAVASLELPSSDNLIASSERSLLELFIPQVQAAPPPPPPPPSAAELPELILDHNLTGWVWTTAGVTGTFTSPEGLFFIYNKSTGQVN